jgi:hypothetical protein
MHFLLVAYYKKSNYIVKQTDNQDGEESCYSYEGDDTTAMIGSDISVVPVKEMDID